MMLVAACSTWEVPCAQATDLKINLPNRSVSTPVQRLNQEGVEAIRKHQYEKAKMLFYKAYLFDPSDPFTLNNLGFMAELDGDGERAESFYALASDQATDALVDYASATKLKGESFRDVLSSVHDASRLVDRANVQAVRLLSAGRAAEADLVLQRALQLDSNNSFTLNNIGVVKEMEGDFEQALKYYTAAAASPSEQRVSVTVDGAWRGKPVTEMAAASAKKVQERMRTLATPSAQASLFNLRGVFAVNRNDWKDAAWNFLQAYTLDPRNAFSINNLGFVAEMDGDLETAQSYYEQVPNAERANARVGLASRRAAEGMKLFAVADDSDLKVDETIERQSKARRTLTEPVRLLHRDHTPVAEPSAPPPAPDQSQPLH